MAKKGNCNSLIWESFLTGDQEAFAYLYNINVEMLYRYGTKLSKDESLVKDAIQEVFLDLYLKRKTNKTKPENLPFYLLLAMKRNLIKKLKLNRKLADESECELQFEPEYSIEKVIIDDEEEAELNHRIIDVLTKLPSRQREALYLRFNRSMEYCEIAQVLNISIESVRKQVYRALTSIRKQFGK